MSKIYFALIFSVTFVNAALSQFSTAGCNAGVGTGITVGTSCTTAPMNTTGSNTDYWNSATGCNSGDRDDVWWWFTATSTNTRITYSSANDAVLTLFTGACSPTMTSLACADNGLAGTAETITFATTVGTVYSVRAQRYNSDNDMAGTICVYNVLPPPANDAACSATALANDGTCLAAQTNVASTTDWSGGCVGGTATTVFYTTTVTGANNTLNVTIPANTLGGGTINVQCLRKNDVCPADASMTSFGSYCGSTAGPITFSSLAAGTYYLAVSTTAANQGTFTICATQSVTAPLPDDPCDAPTIASNYCSGATAHTNVGAVSSFSSNFFNNNACGDNNQNEVFFKFVATHTSVDITALQGSIGGANAEITLMETTPNNGSCTDPYAILAYSCPSWGTTANFLNALVVGNTYYIAIDHNGGNNREGTFGICLNSYTYTAPVGTGYTCATAIPITTPFVDVSTTVGAGNEWNYSCGFYNFGASVVGTNAIDYEFPGYGTMDKFYSVTVPAGGGYYDYSLTVLNNTLPAAASYPMVSIINACPTLNQQDFGSASTLCQNLHDAAGDGTNSSASYYSPGGDIDCKSLWLPAGSYYIVIDHTRSVFDGGSTAAGSTYNYTGVPTGFQYQFEFNELAAATNHDCAGALNVANGVTQNGNNAGCNYSYGPQDPNSGDFCAYSTENLAWFSFTTGAGQTSVGLTLSNVSGDVQWGVVQGPCGGPYTSAGANALNNPADGYSAANDPCDRVSTASYNTTITGLSANTQYWFVADGNAGTPSSFDISMTNILLPLEFLDFELTNKLDHVLLNWTTASEKDNDYFTIERSFDGINYEKIGKVDGSGTTTSEISYEFKDFDIREKGMRYYRLKQTDFSSVYSYSNLRSIYLNMITVSLSPNPVETELEIAIDSHKENSNSKITICDMTGSVLYSFDKLLPKGVSHVKINTADFAKGMYYVTIQNNDETVKEKFVKK